MAQMTAMDQLYVTTHMVASSAIVCLGSVIMGRTAGVSHATFGVRYHQGDVGRFNLQFPTLGSYRLRKDLRKMLMSTEPPWMTEV